MAETAPPARSPRGPARPVEALADAFEISPVGMALVAPTLEMLAANQALLDVLGARAEDVSALRLRRLLSKHSFPGAIQVARRIRAGEPGPFVLEGRIDRPDGETREVEVSVRRLGTPEGTRGAFLVTVNDVTLQVESMRAARDSAVFLRQVIDLIPHFVFAKDKEGRFLLVNRAVAEAYGSTPIHVLGKTDRDFSASEAEAMAFAANDLEVIRSGRPRLIPEERITTAAGETRLLQTTKVPFRFGPQRAAGLLGVSVDITELRRTEEELRRKTEELDNFFSIALDLLCIADTDGVFHRLNREWERTLGYPIEDLEGRRFFDFVHPDDLQPTLEALGRLREQQQVLNFVNRYRCRDGSYRFIEWRSTPVGSLIFAAARDITERKRAEEELQTSRQMLRSVLDHFPGVVFWKDRRSVYLGCNLAFARGAGLSAVEDIVGKTDFDLPWASTEAEKYRADDREVMDSGRPKLGIVETQHQTDGRVTWFNTNKVPLTAPDGDVFGVLGVAADITEVRRLEEQYRQAQKMEAIGSLAGGVAHDFNNLLQVITGYLELAQLRLATGESPTHELEEVGRATDRAATLVRRLLAFSRRQTMQREAVDLDALITGLAKMLRRLIEERIELHTVSHGRLPMVFADPGHLEQVLVNLCVNARDAMPDGGVLRIETWHVEIDAESAVRVPGARPGTYVVLAVADTGCGIPQENLDRVFEPFFTTKEVGKGTGLGLAMVYGIVKQHGGFVEVQSEPGKGTVFRVFLPAAAPGVAPPSPEDATVPMALGRGETILLAEDDAQVREFAARVLQEAGYRVIVARDGAEAVELAAAEAEAVDLYVLDAVMPKLSGKAVHDTIVARRPGAKVLFCTGYSFDVLHNGGALAGGFNALQKPFSRHALLRRVQELLD
ncbi:MAG TPA: PAS domain S-box protein [Thermoanaerobaculaceae bacterium]|nr:PAS domain S-box protein [Thermoanaerobaculaceae bacterium]HRS16068.1 PAS domain S-box protein [Thermoanaerobaculaceae bacterium]